MRGKAAIPTASPICGHRVDDMMWRTVPEVALNRVSLQHCNETEDVDGHSNKVSFEDVVVSTAPIGCGP